MSEPIDIAAPTRLTDRPTAKRFQLGAGWEIEAKTVRDANCVSFKHALGSALLSLDKQPSDAPYRLLLRLAPVKQRAFFVIEYEAVASHPGLIDWAAVLDEAPDGRREFALRERTLPSPAAQAFTGRITGHLQASERPLFFALQLSRAAGRVSLARLSVRVDEEAAALTPATECSLPPLPASAPLAHYLREGDAAGQAPHPLFDGTWYRTQAPRFGKTALEHYLRHGDAAGLSPHPLFDPAWYRSQKPDLKVRETLLAHYLRCGEKAGLTSHPLFDTVWYRAHAPDLGPSESLLAHYVRTGDSANLSPHPLFEPRWYRAQGVQLNAGETSLAHYLREGDATGLSPHPLFDPLWYRWLFPDLQQSANTLLHLLRSGYDAAPLLDYSRRHPDALAISEHPLVRHLSAQRTTRLGELRARSAGSDPAVRTGAEGTATASQRGNLLHLRAGTQGAVAREQAATTSRPTPHGRLVAREAPQSGHRPRIVVYTCLYGHYEALKEPTFVDPSVRYIAFTDDPNLRSERWEVCVLHDRLGDSRRSSRLPKILPHLYLPDHDVSVYIDASLQWKTDDTHGMVEECLEGHEVALYRHYRRNCIYEEIAICESLSIEHRDLIAFYRAHYASLGVGEHAGLFENTLVVRRNSAAARKLNEGWWRMYLGQRDQLSLMSAIHTTGTVVNAIRHGRQVRNNDYVSFVKHERPGLPQKRPKVYVFIAYAPPSYEQDLGRTYNDYMSTIEDDAYALFLDHDAMFATPDWFELVEQLTIGYAGTECLFVGRTNRIGNPYQRVGALADDHRAGAHAALARCLKELHRDWTADVAQLSSSSGVILLVSKMAWQKVPFSRGFLKVDNRMHIDFRNSGRPVLMPLALYAYHFYRADGDSSHAVRLDHSPRADATPSRSEAAPEHRLKNFVYDEAAGLPPHHYTRLLQPGEWAIFIRADAMFCDKHWYTRAYLRLATLPPSDMVLFSNNCVDAEAPKTDDILMHRSYASARLGQLTLERCTREAAADDLVAFMVSRELLERAPEGASVRELATFLSSGAGNVYRDASTHVFCQAGARRWAATADTTTPTVESLQARLLEQRRVAILTLGFWPNQAGMELMIHNLATHLTHAGDLVTLFAPKPTKPFEEIQHNYLLRRFKDQDDFSRLFELQHAVLPFDVILVQGGLEAASMALAMKGRFGVAVVLRTHGEDIQVDESTGYGYRRDPAKRAIIDHNVRAVDRNIVIGEHIVPIVKEIAPETIIETIHNGVDIEHFRPQPSNFLRERLGLAPEQLVLLTVGRNVRKKAFHLAVEALRLVLQRVPEAVLVHVGKDGNGENLTEIARALGVAESFFRFGELNYFETPLAYASADLFVFPSKVETFGNVTVEALSSGLPCVEFDYSVNRKKIASGSNGYVVPFGDVEQFADRIVELLQDPAKRAAFGAEARRSAVETFSWTRVAGRYRSVFNAFHSQNAVRKQPASGFGGVSLKEPR